MYREIALKNNVIVLSVLFAHHTEQWRHLSPSTAGTLQKNLHFR